MASETAKRATFRSKVLATAVVLVPVIAGALLVLTFTQGCSRPASQSNAGATKAYFFDEETGEVDVRPITEVPPLPGKSGNPTVVLARYFTATTDDAKKLIYLERYTPEAKAALEATRNSQPATPEGLEALRLGPQVRSPEPGSQWYYQQTPEGTQVMGAISTVGPDIMKIRPVSPK